MFFLYHAVQKGNQAVGQNRARIGAYRILQTLYWKCLMHSAYCAKTARGAFGAWSRAWTSHRLFFHLVKLLILFMFSWIFKPFYIWFFTNISKWFLFFCRVWIRLITLHLLLLGKCDKSMHLPWIWCLSNTLGPTGLWQWAHQNSVLVDLSHFTQKSRCAFINL